MMNYFSRIVFFPFVLFLGCVGVCCGAEAKKINPPEALKKINTYIEEKGKELKKRDKKLARKLTKNVIKSFKKAKAKPDAETIRLCIEKGLYNLATSLINRYKMSDPSILTQFMAKKKIKRCRGVMRDCCIFPETTIIDACIKAKDFNMAIDLITCGVEPELEDLEALQKHEFKPPLEDIPLYADTLKLINDIPDKKENIPNDFKNKHQDPKFLTKKLWAYYDALVEKDGKQSPLLKHKHKRVEIKFYLFTFLNILAKQKKMKDSGDITRSKVHERQFLRDLKKSGDDYPYLHRLMVKSFWDDPLVRKLIIGLGLIWIFSIFFGGHIHKKEKAIQKSVGAAKKKRKKERVRKEKEAKKIKPKKKMKKITSLPPD